MMDGCVGGDHLASHDGPSEGERRSADGAGAGAGEEFADGRSVVASSISGYINPQRGLHLRFLLLLTNS